MNKYYHLDNRGRRTISANKYKAAKLDTSLEFLRVLWFNKGQSIAALATWAIIDYVRLMRGLDIEQAAAVLALARWLEWVLQGE